MAEQDERGRRPRFGAAYWVAMASSLILILAGMTVGLFGARLFPVHAAHPHAAAPGLATRPGPAK